ncbi:MAG: Uma2 family endonuclease [Candidatus Competibacteraceae bacterium]|nr:Uma2 family endonuclease [Candidatus Competibacteraceae bacterium]
MSRPAEQFITAADYLALERQAESKSEYLNGCIYTMSGASRNHNRITINLGAMLHTQLRGKSCEPFVNDMRVKVSPTGLYTYPDVVVACDEPRFEDEQLDTLLNPKVIIEVLSESTEKYDRGAKFAHYQKLDSLADYLLIAQNQPCIEHFQRQADGSWRYFAAQGLEAEIDIPTIGCVLRLTEVYERVTFPELQGRLREKTPGESAR